VPLPPIPHAHLTGPAEPERRYRFMEVVRRRLGERRYRPRTAAAYLMWIRRFILFHDRRHPRDLGPVHVAAFLSDLAIGHPVSAATQNQALAALTFLYEGVLQQPLGRVDGIRPARRSRQVPVVLTPREIRAILSRLSEPVRLCAMLMYGSGLRVGECATLRVKDIDLERREIVVRDGKGGRDRRTPLAAACLAPLRHRLSTGRQISRSDEQLGIRTTGVSAALARKYPGADRSWSWQYVFPSTRTFVDAEGVRRRHHVHETVIQRAFAGAVREAGITKRATCHL
jgi:integron integrase